MLDKGSPLNDRSDEFKKDKFGTQNSGGSNSSSRSNVEFESTSY